MNSTAASHPLPSVKFFLTVFSEENRKAFGIDKEPSEDQLSQVAAEGIREVTDFLNSLEGFPDSDYRAVDAALVRWCSLSGQFDPIHALSRDVVQDAIHRLKRGPAAYDLDENGRATGFPDDWADL